MNEPEKKIRVVIAEDSYFVRHLLQKILSSDPRIEVAGAAKNGREAVELVRTLKPDVVTMDIRMPVMDGFEATQIIMSENPVPILVISSSIGSEDLKISFNAIQAGALDIIEKPRGSLQADYAEVGAEIIRRVKMVAEIKVFRHLSPRLKQAVSTAALTWDRGEVDSVVAIGASTGGPTALLRIFETLPRNFPAPILVTQHITEGFGSGCVEWLGRNCLLTVKTAVDGEHVRSGTVYFAPDHGHLGVRPGGVLTIRRSAGSGERMSIDSMIRSVADVFGGRTIAVLLTGMGNDGVDGLRRIRERGGETIVQDERTSMVFGMPKAAIEAGVAGQVLPLEEIVPGVMKLMRRHQGAGKK